MIFVVCVATCVCPHVVAQDPTPEAIASQWASRRVAFLGDSMTDPGSKATTKFYWQYLAEYLGIRPAVYARSGLQWNGLLRKAEQLVAECGDSIEAIIIWAGTNDYNHSVPLGTFYTETTDSVNVNGRLSARRHRTFCMDDTTFCGRINRLLSFLKSRYPDRQIIVVTPIHRGYARFKDTNVQPSEEYANGEGLYLEAYVKTLREAATLWAVPLIDLHALSGLLPAMDEHARYIHDAVADRLHPNAEGHRRIARTLQYQLLALPVEF